jgi:hypothetical protein
VISLHGALIGCGGNKGAQGSGSGGMSGSGGGATTSSSTTASTASASSSGTGGSADTACSTTDPTLTAQEEQLVTMPADSWLDVPGTRFDMFCPANEPAGAHGGEGCIEVIDAWSGGAWDPVHAYMILWGGGHSDYYGNEVYGFSTKTFQWQLLVPGTPVASMSAIMEPMPDGNPDSRHTYDGLAYLTAEDRFFAFGGATAPGGNSSELTWELDVANKKWSQVDPGHTLPSHDYYFMGTAYDEAGHRVFMRNEQGVFVYDLTTNAWTTLIDAGFPPLWPNWATSNYRRGIFDPKRTLFFTIGGKTGDGKPDFFTWDVVAKMPAYTQWVTTGGDDIAGANGVGADLDIAADGIVAWAGGPARVLDLNTKQWTTKSGAGAPAAAVANGTFGRFRYLPRYNVFILVNQPDQDVFFYKHTANCGI